MRFWFLVESVYPVRAVIINQIYYRADPPGYWVCPVDKPDIVPKMCYDRNVGDAESTPDREHNEHGNKGFAGSTAHRRNGVRES